MPCVKNMRVFVVSFVALLVLAAPGTILAADKHQATTGAGEESQATAPEPSSSPSAEPDDTVAKDTPTEPKDGAGEPDEGDGLSAKARSAGAASVTIKNFAFSPKTVTVKVGDTVTWTNQDPVEHTATAKDGSFDTGLLGKGKNGSHTFDKAGTFSYYCKPHPYMTGTVKVEGASADSGDTAGTSGSGSSSSSSSGSGSGSSSGGGKSGSDPRLASTGFDVLPWAALGAALITLGYALRRRIGRDSA